MPAPLLISWWPTRAHSGSDAFSHIVVKSPKPMLEGYMGRVPLWVRYLLVRRRLYCRTEWREPRGATSEGALRRNSFSRQERVWKRVQAQTRNSGQGKHSGVRGSGRSVWRVMVVREFSGATGSQARTSRPLQTPFFSSSRHLMSPLPASTPHQHRHHYS